MISSTAGSHPAFVVGAAPAGDHGYDTLEAIERNIDEVAASSMVPTAKVDALLGFGERVLEHWLVAHDQFPTDALSEGFRLLALQRQGAKGDPSFNACRETCRELVYHFNLVHSEPSGAEASRQATLAAMVTRHVCLFISAKMQVAGIGEFCCAAKPLRSAEA